MGLKISIRTTHQDNMRYESAGDYFLGPDEWLMIEVAKQSKWKYEVCVAMHEFVEAMLAIDRKVSLRDIDRFDITWDGEGEPGDCPESPYHREHLDATRVEKIMAELLGVDWDEYGDKIQSGKEVACTPKHAKNIKCGKCGKIHLSDTMCDTVNRKEVTHMAKAPKTPMKVKGPSMEQAAGKKAPLGVGTPPKTKDTRKK